MAFDPFSVATDSLFQTQLASDGILIDSSDNEYAIRCSLQMGQTQMFSGWNTTYPENITTILIPKKSIGVVLSKDAYSTVQIDNTVYIVDGVIKEDPYTITLSVKG